MQQETCFSFGLLAEVAIVDDSCGSGTDYSLLEMDRYQTELY